MKTIVTKSVMILAALAIFVGGFYLVQSIQTGPTAHLVSELSNAQIEARYGVRFTQVAVTAAGGMIDIRYQVVDPDKVMNMLNDPANAPRLIVRDSGVEVAVNTMDMSHKSGFETGRVYWMLYYNTGNALKSGTVVTLQVGDLKIENILVQ
ncbi:MAG TPA: hypothetical protein VFF78_08375 [Anaerolineaceae bacterium]|nr:hypothetical protein [Anaerolineaceae bacterium]